MNNPGTSSGLRSADAAIMAMPGRLMGIQLIADATNAATLIIYDNASAASGTVLAKVKVAATGVYTDCTLPAEGVVCNNGIYADITGTGAEYIIHYVLGG